MVIRVPTSFGLEMMKMKSGEKGYIYPIGGVMARPLLIRGLIFCGSAVMD